MIEKTGVIEGLDLPEKAELSRQTERQHSTAMGRRRLPANGTQIYLKNVTNKRCVKIAIKAQFKKRSCD